VDNRHLALEAIRKKLIGKQLSYREIYAIMDQISQDRLGDVLTTYFVASGYSKGFNNEEIYYLTRAMVETGERLHFQGIVADKHSIGGIPGTRTTLIVVPIIAACNFKIPKSSSRAITTPAGTADVMEVLSPVTFRKQQIYKIIEKVNACIIWGGSFKIAPADDEIIRIEEPLLFESYDKILVSVMAKKIAFGATHVVIDIPYGNTAKVHKREEAKILKEKFEYLASKFKIKMRVLVENANQPAGFGIGPVLEARDALLVLEQDNNRSYELEKQAIDIASILLDLCLEDVHTKIKSELMEKYGDSRHWAKSILKTGSALSKMREIIEAQGGRGDIESNQLKIGQYGKSVKAKKSGMILSLNNKNISIIARILGAPKQKKAGILLDKKRGDKVLHNEQLCTLYSPSSYNLKEAYDSISIFPLYEFE
jgi:AMP phosphorylase